MFQPLEKLQKMHECGKEKDLDLVHPNDTFQVSEKAHDLCCKLSQKRKTDEEKAVIEHEMQSNAPP